MRMRINKTGHKDATAGVESWFIGVGGFEFSRRANGDNFFIVHNDCAVFDDAKRAEGMSALGSADEGEELGGGVDEHRETRELEIGD